MCVLKSSQKYDFMQLAALCARMPSQRQREGVCWVCVVVKPPRCYTGDQTVSAPEYDLPVVNVCASLEFLNEEEMNGT